MARRLPTAAEPLEGSATAEEYDCQRLGVHNNPKNLSCAMTALGQKRKSSVGLGMSAFGGRAEVDFGWLDVSL